MADDIIQEGPENHAAQPKRSRNPIARFFSAISHFFVFLAGADYHTLREKCTGSEQRKYEAFGATVLVPAIFGFVASAYAVSTLTDITWIIYGFALVWGFIILTIDRALLSSYRAYAGPATKIPQVIMRFSVAFLLGFTIAHPLTLLLFQDTITAEVERSRGEEVEEIRLLSAENKQKLEERITETAAALAAQQEKYQETISASFIKGKTEEGAAAQGGSVMDVSGKEAVEEQIAQSTKAQRERIQELDEQLATHSTRYAKVQEELTHWQQEYEAEIDGSRSGTSGIGPRAKSIQEVQLTPRRDEVKRLGSLLENLTEQRNELSTEVSYIEQDIRKQFAVATADEAAKIREDQQKVAQLERDLKKQQLSIFVSQQDTLLGQIQRQIDAHTEELTRLQAEATQLSADAQEEISKVQGQRRMDLLTQTLALHHLFERGDEGGHFALSVYVILAALFMLIDTIPIIVKLFSNPGEYDELLALKNPETKQRVRLAECRRDADARVYKEKMEAKVAIKTFEEQLRTKRAQVLAYKRETEQLKKEKVLESEVAKMEEESRRLREESLKREAEVRRLEDERYERRREALAKEREMDEEQLELERRTKDLKESRERLEKEERLAALRRETEELEEKQRLAALNGQSNGNNGHSNGGNGSSNGNGRLPGAVTVDEESGPVAPLKPRDEEIRLALGEIDLAEHIEDQKAEAEGSSINGDSELSEEVDAPQAAVERVVDITEEVGLQAPEAQSEAEDEEQEIGLGQMMSLPAQESEEPVQETSQQQVPTFFERPSYQNHDADTVELSEEALEMAQALAEAAPHGLPDVDPPAPVTPFSAQQESQAPEVPEQAAAYTEKPEKPARKNRREEEAEDSSKDYRKREVAYKASFRTKVKAK